MYSLVVSIVNKGRARRLVSAAKKVGAEGGTTIMGTGTMSERQGKSWGIPIEPEKELVLILVANENVLQVTDAIVKEKDMEKKGHGITFTISASCIGGICHLMHDSSGELRVKERNMTNLKPTHELIVTIVNKGHADEAVSASTQAGARGGTIISGRGTGIHEQAKLFGITIEPEKDIVLTLAPVDCTERIMQAIIAATELNKPGKGIAFVLPVDTVAGIVEQKCN